jgi:hypothetical protein
MKHLWHRDGICQYCGLCRRRSRTTNNQAIFTSIQGISTVKTYYTRQGAIWYHVPDCPWEWPEDWMPGMRIRYYKKPPAQQLNLFAAN